MARSVNAVPPAIDGFTFVDHLGGGGFADVFLYQQHLPERQVAVKVLRETVDDVDARRLFQAEANLMAKVSTHPNIVSIYGAGVSTEQRPYLVMEYYPLTHFGERVKAGPLSFQQVLEVGVKLACAVETAHQARIVHRDIKPSNVLVSDFGEPGLTDFGISAAQIDGDTEESLGFSPPYAPPEILLNEHPGDYRSDVYSLSATLWAMLAGHAPFELPGQKNPKSELIARTLNANVPRLSNSSVPPQLELALRQGLEKNPAARPESARALALQLQAVERELGYRETALVLLHDRTAIDNAVAEVEVAAEKTKKGSGIVVNLEPDGQLTNKRSTVARFDDADGSTQVRGKVTPPPLARLEDAPVAPRPAPLSFPGAPAVDDTVKGGLSTGAAPENNSTAIEPSADRRKVSPWVIGVAAAAILAVAGGVVAASGGDDGETAPTSVAVPNDDVVNPGAVADDTLAQVTAVQGVRDGSNVIFTWTHERAAEVVYLVARSDSGADPTAFEVAEPSATIEGADGLTPCITVTAVIKGVVSSDATPPVCVGE